MNESGIFDLDKLHAELPNEKFKHWTHVVQVPVLALTGKNVFEGQERRVKDADAHRYYEEIAMLQTIRDNVAGINGMNIQFFTSKEAEMCASVEGDVLKDLMAKPGPTSFGKRLAGMARKEGMLSGGLYGDFILSQVATKETSGKGVYCYKLEWTDETQPDLSPDAVNPNDVEIRDCNDKLEKQTKIVVIDADYPRLENIIVSSGLNDPKGKTAMRVLMESHEMVERSDRKKAVLATIS